MQRRPHGLLCLSVRRRLSLRPVSSAHGECAPDKVCGHLARFAAVQRGSVHHAARHAFVLHVRTWRNLHAVPGAGLHGRKYARTFFPGLREILRKDRDSQRKLQSKARVPAVVSVAETGSDSGFAARRAEFFRQSDARSGSRRLTKKVLWGRRAIAPSLSKHQKPLSDKTSQDLAFETSLLSHEMRYTHHISMWTIGNPCLIQR